MKTLINGVYYEVTPDMEVMYLNAEIIPVTDDGYYNWGIVYNGLFIRLHTFEVDGVTWYFTNDFQEIEIKTFIAEILPIKGFELSDIEWFKTYPLETGQYNDQFEVYFKINGRESYHSTLKYAKSEAELILMLTDN